MLLLSCKMPVLHNTAASIASAAGCLLRPRAWQRINSGCSERGRRPSKHGVHGWRHHSRVAVRGREGSRKGAAHAWHTPALHPLLIVGIHVVLSVHTPRVPRCWLHHPRRESPPLHLPLILLDLHTQGTLLEASWNIIGRRRNKAWQKSLVCTVRI